MYPCNKCLENNWKIEYKKELDENKCRVTWVEATCYACGNVVHFGYKKFKKKEHAKAEYQIRDGKHFLKINGEYREVELARVNGKSQRDPDGKFLRVLPVLNLLNL